LSTDRSGFDPVAERGMLEMNESRDDLCESTQRSFIFLLDDFCLKLGISILSNFKWFMDFPKAQFSTKTFLKYAMSLLISEPQIGKPS
jgi:hypothetical protein